MQLLKKDEVHAAKGKIQGQELHDASGGGGIMKGNGKKKVGAAFVLGLMVLSMAATESYGVGSSPGPVCSTGVAEPPFLSYGVDPNVLLMIDNSGSMYDPAYIQTTPLSGSTLTTPPQCYDESYDLTGATSYAGYFEKETWYTYVTASNQFTKPAAAPACAGYYAQDSTATKYLCIDLITTTTPKTVSSFAAKGNFLNWAATSKFDIQKKILTGGKYDSVNGQMLLESRGCSDRRFVKQVTLAQTLSGTPYKLALGVRGPMEVYDNWRPSTAYVSGAIVQSGGTLYKAIASFTSTAVFTADPAKWVVYRDTRWYPGHAYPAGASVYDVASDSWFRTIAGGTSLGTATNLAGDTAVTWEPYHGTEIEIYNIQAGGFNALACQQAIAELNSASPSLGQLGTYTDNCMGYAGGNPNSEEGASNGAFNHSLQECWYYSKHGDWQNGAGTVTSLKNDCEGLYEYLNPVDISPWDTGYACYGSYAPAATSANGYIGRCWEPGGSATPLVCTSSCGTHAIGTTWLVGSVYYACMDKLSTIEYPGGELYKCSKSNASQCELIDNFWGIQETCTGGGSGAAAGWTDDPLNNGVDNSYACVDQALKDFCGIVSVPEVIDPSDATNSTGVVWNAPAMLVDSGIMGQLDSPLAIMKVRIAEATAPEGLIQKNSDQMRIGVIRFNDNGAKTECDDNAATAPTAITAAIAYDCPDDNRDGAKVISEIKLGSTVTNDKGTPDTTDDLTHGDDLVTAINGIEANSWTPLGEAMFTAIGYYTQNDAFKCQTVAPQDFTVGVNPVQYWCQNNHIILITDGSSTADLNAVMMSKITTAPVPDYLGLPPNPDVPVVNGKVCTDGLYGSTYLDNFTSFAAQSPASSLYPAGNNQLPAGDDITDMRDKQNIKTHIVVSGSLRDTGDDECSPDVILEEAAEGAKLNATDVAPLYVSTNYDALETNLSQVFAEIRSGASAGSAASVISSSRGGEGAIYQAIFWPSKPSSDLDSTATVKWAGEVHSLFIDTHGYMYEDSNGDRKLTVPVPPALGDKRVTIYFDNTALISKGCYAPLNSDGTCNAPVDLDAVHYLWSANNWLAKISNLAFTSPGYNVDDQYLNRAPYISNQRRRYIFTWNDLNNDGIVDSNENLPFVSKNAAGTATNWTASGVAPLVVASATRRPVTNDFNLDVAGDNAEVNKIVEWIRGVELTDVDATGNPKYRSRKIAKKMDGVTPDPQVVWRLGDVVHSTPTAVARPMEGLHLLYKDTSYANFVTRWTNRRNMAYFGANDGMLHGVNGGFYNETTKKFCLAVTEDGNCADETGVPELGAEMWAYVPYNLLPHLKCLTDPSYVHKYYVDQRPRVFDARIFSPDDIHTDGWGTVLVGSMGFGGARVEGDRLSGDTNSGTDNRDFTSSYFLLDITNPELPPVLLGEFTRLEGTGVDLGFTTASPTPVVMKTDTGPGEWYLLMGSGPTMDTDSDGIGTLRIFDAQSAIQGKSNQKPKVAVFPLKGLTQIPKKAFRIPDAAPTAPNETGRFTFTGSSNGFVSDMISVDYDLDANYKTDAVYFGTVEHGTDLTGSTPTYYEDDWDGQLYRIVMRALDGVGNQIATAPHDWSTLTPINGTGFKPLFNAHQPITAAPAVGTDQHNYWVYFGTGRFYDAGVDKPDNAQQSFYGIKELTNCDGTFPWTSNIDKTVTSSIPGHRGLFNASNVLVDATSTTSTSAKLFCTPADLAAGVLTDLSCLPGATTTLGSLITDIAGSGTSAGSSCVDNVQTGTDGWYRDFPMTTPRERNVGQATLLGGLLTFTTYQPYEDLCQQEGQAFLYGLYYQTGTAWYQTVFGDRGLEGNRVLESISLGRGLATTPNLHVGSEEGTTAFIQTSTGEIIEMPQTNLPYSDFKTGRKSWRER